MGLESKSKSKLESTKRVLEKVILDSEVSISYVTEKENGIVAIKGPAEDLVIGLVNIIIKLCNETGLTVDRVLTALRSGLKEAGADVNPILPLCDTGVAASVRDGNVTVELNGEYDELMTALGIIVHAVSVGEGKDPEEICDDIFEEAVFIEAMNEERIDGGGTIC